MAFRRFRLPIPVRVRVDDGRPVRVTTDRHGVTGGAIVQAAGPWRTSGEWWAVDPSRDEPPREPSDSAGPEPRESRHARPGSYTARPAAWDRDEWDIAMADGTVYRLFVERAVGQWFLEGIID